MKLHHLHLVPRERTFPTGLPPSRHCSFHQHAPITQYAAHGCTPLSTHINTLAYCQKKIRRQIHCPKITREKNDTPSDLMAPWLSSEWSPAPPTHFSWLWPLTLTPRGQERAMFKECKWDLWMDWPMLCNVRWCWLMSASQVSYSLFLFCLCFLLPKQIIKLNHIYIYINI